MPLIGGESDILLRVMTRVVEVQRRGGELCPAFPLDGLAGYEPSQAIHPRSGRDWRRSAMFHAMAEQLLAGQPVEVPDGIAPKVEAVARWAPHAPPADGVRSERWRP